MNKLLAASLILALVAVPPAWAGEHRGQGRGHGEVGDGRPGKAHGGGKHGQERGRRDRISAEQRGIARDYYHQEYIARGLCPPGLAKKGTGCLPPGQAKKRYWGVGRPLPPAVVLEPLPPELILRLGVPPAGHAWGYVDGRIVLYALGARIVVDIVDGLF